MTHRPSKPHAPYADPAINRLYNMLFCDDAQAFAPDRQQGAAPWQAILYADPVDPAAVSALATDGQLDARVRALAMSWLQQHGHPVPARQLLGVVLEVPVDSGLDVLAAYADGSVRYLHHAAQPTLIEGGLAPLQPTVERLLRASQAIVDRIGPWDKERLPAPSSNVRLSFVVSDGLYFGEGPMQALAGDPMAGPVLEAGGRLLGQVVDLVSA